MAEKEYIERLAAIEQIRLLYCKDCNSYNGIRCRACEFDDAMLLIEDIPTADVVEVVRCKDCQCYEMDVEYYGGGHKDICRLFKRQTYHDDYCSYGERREQQCRS